MNDNDIDYTKAVEHAQYICSLAQYFDQVIILLQLEAPRELVAVLLTLHNFALLDLRVLPRPIPLCYVL